MSDLFTLPPDLDFSTLQWTIAIFASLLVGLSKGGIKGLNPFFVLIMAHLFETKASTGIIVPLFIVGDILAVWYYNRHAQWSYLRAFLPWMMLGVLIAVWVGKDLPEETFKNIMAVIILVSIGILFWWDRQKNPVIPDHWWFAGLVGIVAGFTTMIGNLASAFTVIFFMAMRLPKNQFIGTAAWLYLIINVFKLGFHIFSWKTVTWSTLAIDLRLVPSIFVGMGMGIFLVKKIKEDFYRKFVLIITALGAVWILVGN